MEVIGPRLSSHKRLPPNMYNHPFSRLHACTETLAFCKLGVEEHTWGTWHCVLIITPSTLTPCSAAFMYEYVLYHTAGNVSAIAELFFLSHQENFHDTYSSCKLSDSFLSIRIFTLFSSMCSREVVDLFKLQRRYMYYCCWIHRKYLSSPL